ncbi:unnamed protein product [Lactuca virosa]|uniref:Uncharacterized protein n=1 Tax=Lactuca virosa TaxID=75947 RepID=A0AAU9N3L3_9ASTR|nr:unnamed protein product [Lactuca virosa]
MFLGVNSNKVVSEQGSRFKGLCRKQEEISEGEREKRQEKSLKKRDEKILGKFFCDMMIDDEDLVDDCVNVSDEKILDDEFYPTDGFEGF